MDLLRHRRPQDGRRIHLYRQIVPNHTNAVISTAAKRSGETPVFRLKLQSPHPEATLDQFLIPRLLTAFAIDIGIAVLTGLLLANLWLRTPAYEPKLPAFKLPAIRLFLALCAQVIVLTATFSGETAPGKLLAAMPDVLSTHAGRIAEWTAIAGFALAAFTLLKLKPTLQIGGTALLLSCVVLLRSATGHAAVDGDFSLAELLQAVHLTSMALWAGGVLISGLLVVPRFTALAQPGKLHRYISSLSLVSTYAVAAVALSGLVKSYRAIGGDVHQLKGNTWSTLLIAKIVCVSAAIALGGLNRLHLGKRDQWQEPEERRAATLLKAEAWLMLAVLALSAWLANMSPPGE